MRADVSVILTWDVHSDPVDDGEMLTYTLARTTEMLGRFDTPSTFFFVARAAEQVPDEVRRIGAGPHEVGCHGLTHGDEEEYPLMPAGMQRDYLTRATEVISGIARTPLRSFRGPRVKTSHVAQGILEDLGYATDCSVCSQRLDFLSSNKINPGWVLAPRLPYHPHESSPYLRGSRRLWVVPVSALLAPFISSTLNIVRPKAMKIFFDLLYRESLRNGKPIVYLGHPEEFATPEMAARRATLDRERSAQRGAGETRAVHGYMFRGRLYEKEGARKLAYAEELIRHMRSKRNVRFTTLHDYVSNLGS